jgi:hypothetical protein
MPNRYPLLLVLGLLLSLTTPAAAQQSNNDGFHRRNGQMHVLRNGQLRPMTRNSRLPTGVLVTKDGFLVSPNGRRTELHEGQGCDLKGNVVAVASAASGGLVLAPAARSRRRAPSADDQARAVLSDLFGRGRQREDDYDDDKHGKKKWGKRKKEEEKRWEWEKKREEKAREQAKKWEEKRREGKGWDD